MPCNLRAFGFRLALALAPALAFATDFAVPGDWALQDALNAAQGGDTITIDASIPITGNFVLPATPGPVPITVRTSNYQQLPDRRILPSDTDLLAKIISPNSSPAIKAASGSNGWRLLGLEIITTTYAYQAIQLGEAIETSPDALPGDLELDRLYIHADPSFGGKRAVELNSRNTTIRNCYMSQFWSNQQDAQAIAGWNGPGPYDIVNNYLEGSGENVIFGGASTTVPNVIPSDIRIIGNYISRPASWFNTSKIVKNVVEFKNAQRVLVDGNILENNWMGGQSGYSLVFTVRTEYGTVPWAVVKDITFQNNIVRASSGGVEAAGYDNITGQGSSGDIRILNNVFDIGKVPAGWGLTNRFLLVFDGVKNIKFNHNTIFHLGDAGIGGVDGMKSSGFVFDNNIVPHNIYGVISSVGGIGVPGLNNFVPGYSMRNNVIIGTPTPKLYVSGTGDLGTASGNLFPTDLSGVRFQNVSSAQYQLAGDSLYRKAGTDGQDVGVDMSALTAATRYTTAGNPPPPPDITYSVNIDSAPFLLIGDTFSASWTLASRGHLSDWVGVFDAAQDNSTPLYVMRTNGAASGKVIVPAFRAGNFEFRYVAFSGDTMASASFSAANRVVAMLTVTKLDRIYIQYRITSGIPNASDVIALLAPDGTTVATAPIQGSTGATSFELPTTPGAYSVKYLIAGVKAITSTNVPIP